MTVIESLSGGASPRNKNWNGTQRYTIICSSPEHFRLIVRDELTRWNDQSDINTFFLSIDGLSGSGKTTLANQVRSVVQSIAGLDLYRHAIDHFVATPRGSDRRNHMTGTRTLFWQYVFDRRTMIEVALEIAQADGRACSIPVQTLYDRGRGEVLQGTVLVPAGRKVVLVDGIDSTRIMQEIASITSCQQLRVLLMNPPHVALERAAQRDKKRSQRTLQESREYRRREFRHLIPQIIEQNIRYADLLYME